MSLGISNCFSGLVVLSKRKEGSCLSCEKSKETKWKENVSIILMYLSKSNYYTHMVEVYEYIDYDTLIVVSFNFPLFSVIPRRQ